MGRKMERFAWLIILLVVALISTTCNGLASNSPAPTLTLSRSPDTPESRNVAVDTQDEVTLKIILTANFADIQVDLLNVNVFRFQDGDISPAQPGDIANMRIDVEPDYQLTLHKDLDPNTSSVTFSESDWLSTPPKISEGTSKTLSIVFDIPATCEAPGLFVTTGEMGDITATNVATGEVVSVSGKASGTVMVIVPHGALIISPAPKTPPARIIAVGDDGVVSISQVNFTATPEEDILVQTIPIKMTGGRDADFGLISLWEDNAQLPKGKPVELFLANSSANFNFPADALWRIPAGETKTLTIVANLNGLAEGTVSGDAPRLCVEESNVIAIGAVSANPLTPDPLYTEVCGNEMVLRKSKPTIAAASLPSSVLSAGEKVLFCWTITADDKGDIGWKDIEFDISGTLDSRTIGSGYAPEYSEDAIYTIVGNADDLKGIVEIEVWDATNNSQVSGTVAYVNTLSSGSNVIFEATNEQVVINGQTKTYEFRGNVLYNGKAGDYIATKIKSKATELVSGNYASLLNLASSFIWTDRSANNHSENTSDWTTDYLVPGIPTTTLFLKKDGPVLPEPTSSITVLSPNGGEEWQVGETQRVSWQANGVKYFRIYIYDDTISGSGCINYIYDGALPADAEHYDWTIRQNQLPGGASLPRQYKIRIDGLDEATVGAPVLANDHSDDYFTIVEPALPEPPTPKTFKVPGEYTVIEAFQQAQAGDTISLALSTGETLTILVSDRLDYLKLLTEIVLE